MHSAGRLSWKPQPRVLHPCLPCSEQMERRRLMRVCTLLFEVDRGTALSRHASCDRDHASRFRNHCMLISRDPFVSNLKCRSTFGLTDVIRAWMIPKDWIRGRKLTCFLVRELKGTYATTSLQYRGARNIAMYSDNALTGRLIIWSSGNYPRMMPLIEPCYRVRVSIVVSPLGNSLLPPCVKVDGAYKMWGENRLYRSKIMADDRNGD